MKLTAKTIDAINLRLESQKFIAINNGSDIDNIKDELYEIDSTN